MPPQSPILVRTLPQPHDLPSLISEGISPSPSTVYGLEMVDHELPLPTKLAEHFSELRSKGLLWRSAFANAWKRLGSMADKTRLLVDGPRGVGKSAMLLIFRELLVRKRPDARILYFPRIGQWTAGYYAYMPSQHDTTTPAETLNDNTFIQPDLAWDILRWNASSLISNGNVAPIEDCQLAVEQLKVTLTDLNDSAGTAPVLIIADEVNALFAPTGYRNAQGHPLAVNDLTVPRLVKKLITNPQVILLAATCRSNPALVMSTLGEAADINAVSLSLPYFEVEETLALLRYYEALGHVSRQGSVDLPYARKMNFVTGGCPQHLLPYYAYESIYRRR